MLNNPVVGIQELLNPSAGKGFRIGTIISRSGGKIVAKTAYSDLPVTIFGTTGNVGDTIIFDGTNLISVIKTESLEIVDIP